MKRTYQLSLLIALSIVCANAGADRGDAAASNLPGHSAAAKSL